MGLAHLGVGRSGRSAAVGAWIVADMSMIEVAGLAKAFGDTQAVSDISFTVPRGTVLGVLGPNGSGKTTTVRMLATLVLVPDAGRITINGVDAVADPGKVRTMIGLAGQYASVDERLTVKENLKLIARLAHLPRSRCGPLRPP